MNMLHRRTYVTENRAELIRFSESLFQAIPQNLLHVENTPFEMMLTGDTQSAKSLVPLGGLYALSDVQAIDDLLRQIPGRVGFDTESPYSINNYLKQGESVNIPMNGRNVAVAFEHDAYLEWLKKQDYGQEKFNLLREKMQQGGLSLLTYTTITRLRSRMHFLFPKTPRRIDVRKTVKQMTRNPNDHRFDKRLQFGACLEKYLRPYQRLSGAWKEVAQNDPSHDVDLPRSIVLYVDDKTELGSKLIKSKKFLAFWNNTQKFRCPISSAPQNERSNSLK